MGAARDGEAPGGPLLGLPLDEQQTSGEEWRRRGEHPPAPHELQDELEIRAR